MKEILRFTLTVLIVLLCGEVRSLTLTCEAGFTGAFCQFKCPDKCSSHGRCYISKRNKPLCKCEPGFSGTACKETEKCPRTCGDNGVCRQGNCLCNPGFTGTQCKTEKKCTNNCNGKGLCYRGLCHCYPGYSGKQCTKKLACPSNCSGHGICRWGKCQCEKNISGEACNQFIGESTCISDSTGVVCNNNGVCLNGTCWCRPYFSGTFCEILQKTNHYVDSIEKPKSLISLMDVCLHHDFFIYFFSKKILYLTTFFTNKKYFSQYILVVEQICAMVVGCVFMANVFAKKIFLVIIVKFLSHSNALKIVPIRVFAIMVNVYVTPVIRVFLVENSILV